LKRGHKSLGVIFPQFSALDAKIMIEREVLDERKFVRQEFGKFALQPDIGVVPLEPGEDDIKAAVRLAQASEMTIFFLYDAHLYPSNRSLLDAVQEAAPRLAVVLLRDPYDADFIKEGVACLTAFGWRACQIRAAIEKMCL